MQNLCQQLENRIKYYIPRTKLRSVTRGDGWFCKFTQDGFEAAVDDVDGLAQMFAYSAKSSGINSDQIRVMIKQPAPTGDPVDPWNITTIGIKRVRARK